MPVIVLAVVAVPIVLAVWLIVRAIDAKQSAEKLSRRLDTLEAEILRLKQDRESARPIEPAPAPEMTYAEPPVAPEEPAPAPEMTYAELPVASEEPAAAPPVIPPRIQAALHRLTSAPATPPMPPAPASEPPEIGPPEIEPPRPAAPAVNWEQFMGVKLFAWIGGLALFIGVAFFVKYSFDNNLVPPELRVALGFLAGVGLLVGGVMMSRRDYPALSQTLCATGVAVLYTVTFACRSIYRFEFFGVVPTFLLMSLITMTAFLLAVRLNALTVAILGMLGGFLTPILISTGQDNPFGLFGYIAILDTGLILVALRRRWLFLTALGALGTAIMQILWAGKFFEAGKYFEGNKILIPLSVLLGFNALYLAVCWLGGNRKAGDSESPDAVHLTGIPAQTWLSVPALGLAAVALAFSAWFLGFEPLAQRPWLMFGFVFLVDLCVVAVALADETIAAAQYIAGFAVFGLLAYWTRDWLADQTLNAALAFYLVFAVLHSALPELLRRRGVAARGWAIHIFPLLALMLVLGPIFKLAEVSFLVWPFILLVDLLAIALAVLTTALWPVLAVLLLTLAATGMLIFKIPPDLAGLTASFFLLGAFAVFFVVASVWIARKFMPDALKSGIRFNERSGTPGEVAAMLPACSVALPFLLLIMATLRLPLADPAPVFGLGLLLTVLLLGVTRLFLLDWMPAIGLACVAALECAWHFNRFNPANPHQPLNLVLAWYLVFYAVFALFPFLFARKFANKAAPWGAAAMAGPAQFFLIYHFIKAVHPGCPYMGLLPAAFAVPGLLSLIAVLKKVPAVEKARMAQAAWFGGVALFFITLIFPIQFDRQWITIGWALEGAALLWLFQRVPHPGLRLAGLVLLAAAFTRLALNPAVLDYHARATTPVFNWYLYAYGIVTAALFAGARLLAPPRNVIFKSNAQQFLYGLGTVLAFLLLNIEIADYFSAPGSTLTFEISGNFARDMTYSIAWALFALALLVAGILKKTPAARYGAIGLLCVTLLKLFFHDLAQHGQLYRIGAFIGVAVIVMLASFAYQKFFSAGRAKESKDETQQ
jgi:hypothetical protein